MQELRCPHCGEVFQVDETGYAQLARQVRDSEFDKELRRREHERLARRAAHRAHEAQLNRPEPDEDDYEEDEE